VNTSILPRTDNTYDLGSASYRWANLYVRTISAGGATLNIDESKIYLGSSAGGTEGAELQFRGTDGSTAWWMDVNASNEFGIFDNTTTQGILIDRTNYNLRSRSIIPWSDDAYDLGNTNYIWHTLHVSAIRLDDGNTQYYPNVFTITQNDTVTGAWIIHTPLPRTTSKMFIIHVEGYWYGAATGRKILNFWISGYLYNAGTGNVDGQPGAVINYNLVDLGTDKWTKWVGIDENDKLAIAIGNTTDTIYFGRLRVDFWCATDSAEDWSEGWSFSLSTTDGFGWGDIHSLSSYLRAPDYIWGSLIPATNNAYDLGSSSYRWANGYFSNTVVSKFFRVSNLYFSENIWWSTGSLVGEIRYEASGDGILGFHSTGGRLDIAYDGGLAILHENYEATPFGNSAWRFMNSDMVGESGNDLHIRSNWDWIYFEPDEDKTQGESGLILRRLYDSTWKERVKIKAHSSGSSAIRLTGLDGDGNWGFYEWSKDGENKWIHWKAVTESNIDKVQLYYYDGSNWNLWMTYTNDGHYCSKHFSPASDNTYNLGSASYRWKDLYLSTANSLLELLARHKGPFWFNSHWLPSGMMTYATTGSGTVSWYDNYVGLGTGTTSGSTVKTYKRFYGFNNTYSWDKKRVFGAEVYFSSYTNQVVWIVSGWITDITASSATDRHIGFKLVNGTLYGTVADGTTEATLTLKTLSSDAHMTLEYVYTPGSEVRFYVDGVDKGAITTNLPSGTINALYALFASVYNSAAEQKRLNIYDIRVIQEE